MERRTQAAWRLDRIPAAAWLAGFGAILLALAAFATNMGAMLLMVFAALVAAWAVREARYYVITPQHDDSIEMVGLAELSPLLEALPDPALLVDREGRLVASNAAARRQMQFEPRGQFLTSILRQPDVLEAVQAAVGEGMSRAVEYETSLQVERHTRCYIAPVTWGVDRAALLVFHDQTARISTERMRADFLANASHELRTPLASLSLLIETLSGSARDDAAGRDRFLKMMQVQAGRMRRLIDDLLSLSRIELDEHVPPSDRADLVAVAHETVDMMAETARERGVGIDIVAPQQPALAVGDRFQLAQVAQNLIDNALKYSPEGSKITVEIGLAEDRDGALSSAGRRWEAAGRISLLTPAAAANRSYVYMRVEDAGPGIAQRFLPRLGERFFRVERELGDERGGTGLGLAIVKHIVNRHRGGLMVESELGRGTAFAAYVEQAGED